MEAGGGDTRNTGPVRTRVADRASIEIVAGTGRGGVVTAPSGVAEVDRADILVVTRQRGARLARTECTLLCAIADVAVGARRTIGAVLLRATLFDVADGHGAWKAIVGATAIARRVDATHAAYAGIVGASDSVIAASRVHRLVSPFTAAVW